MIPSLIARLKLLAANVAPGPWKACEVRYNYDQVIRGKDQGPIAMAQLAGYSKQVGRNNAELIALCSPSNITALLAYVERLEEVAEAVRKEVGIGGRLLEALSALDAAGELK